MHDRPEGQGAPPAYLRDCFWRIVISQLRVDALLNLVLAQPRRRLFIRHEEIQFRNICCGRRLETRERLEPDSPMLQEHGVVHGLPAGQ
jgi:hypothetical protein